MERKNDNWLIITILFFSILSVLWVAGIDNSLTYDDFTLLSEAHFGNYSDLFSFFPTMFYNDRPLRAVFLKMLNDMFGMNYQIYHIIFIFIHVLNVYLVYQVAKKIFDDGRNQVWYAGITAMTFGIYTPSLMAVSWISAVADLECCLFSLLAILYYLKGRTCNQKHSLFYNIFSVLFYYLSIRSKEMSLILPVLFMLYEVEEGLRLKHKLRITFALAIQLLIMLCFAGILFLGSGGKLSPEHPYYQSFSVSLLLRNAIRYLFIYYDWGNAGFTFTRYSVDSLVGVCIFCIICIYSFWLTIKEKNFSLLFSVFGVGISLAVVLPMVNMQHRLYLYIPSVFVGIMYACTAREVTVHMGKSFLKEFSIIFIFLLWLVGFTPGQVQYRQNWLYTCGMDKKQLIELSKLEAPVKGSNIYIKGANDTYNIYYYGPGNSIRLLFDENDYLVELVEDFPQAPNVPYVFWEFDGIRTQEVERSDLFEIISVYPDEIVLDSQNTVYFIGVTMSYITANLEVVVNGTGYPTTIGEDFISIAVPANELKETLEIYVLDKETGKRTESCWISVK